MLQYMWVIRWLKMFNLRGRVINFTLKTMENWKVELAAGRQPQAEVKIQRAIIQGDSLSSLLFVVAMMPHNNILRKCTGGYKFTISYEDINHLIYINDPWIWAKTEKERRVLVV